MTKLKGDQHKLDTNGNGKLDAHDFMLLRKKKSAEKKSSTDVDVEESFVVKDHQGKPIHISLSESDARRKATELTKKTGNEHSVVYTRSATVAKEEYELDLSESAHFYSRPTYKDFINRLHEAKKCMKEEDDEDIEDDEKPKSSKSKIKFHSGEDDGQSRLA